MEHGPAYEGLWVALADGTVVAAGPERDDVAARARGTGRRVVLVEVGGRGEVPRALF